MGHSQIFFIANSFVVLLILRALVDWAPQERLKTINELTDAEWKLHVCGSLAAGINNLSDTVQMTRQPRKHRYEIGLDVLQTHIQNLRRDQALPTTEDCVVTTRLGASFTADPYRLNEIDQPHRKINWAYGIAFHSEI